MLSFVLGHELGIVLWYICGYGFSMQEAWIWCFFILVMGMVSITMFDM